MEIDQQKFNQFKEMIDNYKSIPAYFLSDQSGQYINYYKNGHKIHIKKENRGKFTKSAKNAGMSVQQYASKVLANKDKYSSTIVKRANFARNASKWKK